MKQGAAETPAGDDVNFELAAGAAGLADATLVEALRRMNREQASSRSTATVSCNLSDAGKKRRAAQLLLPRMSAIDSDTSAVSIYLDYSDVQGDIACRTTHLPENTPPVDRLQGFSGRKTGITLPLQWHHQAATQGGAAAFSQNHLATVFVGGRYIADFQAASPRAIYHCLPAISDLA